MRIIDTFRYWKFFGTLVLLIMVIWLWYDNVNKQNEIWDKNSKISKIESDYKFDLAKKDGEITELKSTIEELEWEIEDLEWEKEELYVTTNNITGNIKTIKENSEWMVKVINNGTLLTEAIDTYIKNYNNFWQDNFMTESTWKKVEDTAKCYAESVNSLKNWMAVFNCY